MKEKIIIEIDEKEYQMFEKGEYFITETGKWYRFEKAPSINGKSGIYNVKVSDEEGRKWFLKFCSVIFDEKEKEKESWQENNLKRESSFRFFYPYIEHITDAFYGEVVEELSENVIIHKKYYAVCMEYVEGKNLVEDCKEQKKLIAANKISQEAVEQRMFCHMMQLLYGIHYYMNYAKDPYIHRDLKPQNIMISKKEDKVMIIDFDYAHISGSKATDNMDLNAKRGMSCGYIAPDAVANKKTDIAAEIYSIGRIFCYWLGGRDYFRRDEIEYISEEEQIPFYCHKTELGFGLEKSRFIERYQSDKYKKIRKIIEKMCTNPNERYQKVSDIIVDMKGFLWEYCVESVKEREEFLQSNQIPLLKVREEFLQFNQMPLLKEREERREEQAPDVYYKVLSEGEGRIGAPLLDYSMRKIKIDNDFVMTIYNLKNRVYYIPVLGGRELIRERKGNDFEIQDEDIFKVGDFRIQFYIKQHFSESYI